jgi:tetratricopeptide (TPR) repeat protein
MATATWYEEKVSSELEKIIDSAMMEEPEAAYLLTAKGVVEMRKGNWAFAIELLEKAIEKSPEWLIPRYQLGICYVNKKNYRKALSYYEEVLAKDTLFKTFECTKCILGNMAAYALKIKQYQKAVGFLIKCIDLFPDYFAPYQMLYEYTIEKKDTIAANELVGRLKRFDDTVFLRLTRIKFQKEFFGYPITLSELDSVKSLLKTNIDSADYYSVMSLIYIEEDDDDSARYYINKAIRLDPTEPFYLYQMINILLEHREYEEIIDLIDLHIHHFEGEDKDGLLEEMMFAYLDTKQYPEALKISIELKGSGYYDCDQLKKLKKAFKKLPEYESYIKNCRDN